MSAWLHVAIPVATFLLGLIIGNRHGGDDQADMFCVLVALWDGEASATQIHERLAGLGSKVRLMNVYPLMRSLERSGVVASREVPGGPERGGRPRILYFIPALRVKLQLRKDGK